MIITNKKSGYTGEITEEQWESMKAKNLHTNFEILANSSETPKISKSSSSYKELIAKGLKAETDENFDLALTQFEEAYTLKQSESLRKKIEKLKEKIQN